MFAIIFTFAVITAHVTAEIPSYIHVCGRDDSNYNQCIVDSINHMKNKICTGIPEFDISPNEPSSFDKVVVFETDSIKFYLRNAKLYNFCDFVVKSVNTNAERRHFEINILYPQIYVNTTYDFNIRLVVPIAHKGLVSFTSDNLEMKISLDLKVITKNGKKHIFASKANAISDANAFKYTFDQNEKELVEMHKIIDDIATNNEKDIIRVTKVALEERISILVISIFNKIARSNYEILFP